MAPARVLVDFVHIAATISEDASEFVAVGCSVMPCRADEHKKGPL